MTTGTKLLTLVNGIRRWVSNIPLQAYRPIVNVTASKSFAVTDANTYQNCTNTSAIVLTIPADTFAVLGGCEIEVARNGAGTIELVPAATVTLNGVSTSRLVSTQYQVIVLKWLSANTWVAHGSY